MFPVTHQISKLLFAFDRTFPCARAFSRCTEKHRLVCNELRGWRYSHQKSQRHSKCNSYLSTRRRVATAGIAFLDQLPAELVPLSRQAPADLWAHSLAVPSGPVTWRGMCTLRTFDVLKVFGYSDSHSCHLGAEGERPRDSAGAFRVYRQNFGPKAKFVVNNVRSPSGVDIMRLLCNPTYTAVQLELQQAGPRTGEEQNVRWGGNDRATCTSRVLV